MRIHLKIDTRKTKVPFDHQHLLVGTIHKWLGWNEEHGKLSLYSFSRLEGGKTENNELSYEKSASFFFSSHKIGLIQKMIAGIQADPSMFLKLMVTDVTIEEDPDLSNRELFFPASPIFIKRHLDQKSEHILFDDPRANDFLRETLLSKMEEAEMMDDSMEIRFDLFNALPGTKMINYKGIGNRANWCSVIIKGKPETKLFAWNVGLGNSTGIGFGAIK